MDRRQIGGNVRTRCIALETLVAAILLSPFPVCPAQTPANSAQSPANAAPPRVPVPAPHPVSGLLQPSLDTVHQTLGALRIDRWKKGTVRDEASGNINSIQRDLEANLPPLLRDADAASGSVSKLLPLSRHVDALYDVLLRVTEASRVIAPDDQAAQLQQALLSLGNARLSLDDRMLGSADALEQQVVYLRATIQQQAAQRQAAPAPVALPCVPPPAHKTTTRTHKPAAKPAPKPSATTPAGKTPGATTQPTSSH